MVDEIVHFQYSSLETFSIAQNALLELLHIFFLFISRLSVFLSGMAEMWDKDNTKKVKNAASATENKRTGNVLQRKIRSSDTPHREGSRKHLPSFRPQSTGLPRKHSIN